MEYLNTLSKDYNKRATQMRNEFERIANEISLKFKHKMLLLREDMEQKRKDLILQIETRKNLAIKNLTAKHQKKYDDIKNYYSEITSTNLDIIKQLKDELSDAKKEDTKMQKKKMDCEEENKKVVEPLQRVSEELKQLSKMKLKHSTIKGSLEETQHHIGEQDAILKDIEW